MLPVLRADVAQSVEGTVNEGSNESLGAFLG
jgi:hypothetical protein